MWLTEYFCNKEKKIVKTYSTDIRFPNNLHNYTLLVQTTVNEDNRLHLYNTHLLHLGFYL